MANLFANVPFSPGAVATDMMVARKCLTVTGMTPGTTLVVEASPGPGIFDTVARFDNTNGVRVVDALAFEMRARMITGSPAGISVDVAAEESCPCIGGEPPPIP